MISVCQLERQMQYNILSDMLCCVSLTRKWRDERDLVYDDEQSETKPNIGNTKKQETKPITDDDEQREINTSILHKDDMIRSQMVNSMMSN